MDFKDTCRARPHSQYVARARRNIPVEINHLHPLAWWRARAAESFKSCDIFTVRQILKKSAIIGEPYWLLGARGDAAVAIGVALRVRKKQPTNCVLLDLAMTAVMCVALEGNAAAALLLSATLKGRASTDPACDALSDSWLAEKPPKKASRRTDKAKLPPL